MKGEAKVATVGYSAEPQLRGSDDIAAGETEFRFTHIPFVLTPGDLWRYVVRAHNGTTYIDTGSSPFGIECLR